MAAGGEPPATNPDRLRSRGGWALIELIVVVSIITLLLALTLAGVQRVRASAARVACANNQRQLGKAVHNYVQQNGRLPPGVVTPTAGELYPYMSWLVRLLPHLGEEPLWRTATDAFAANPDFLQVPPHTGLATPVRVFACPTDSRVATTSPVTGSQMKPRAFTSYLGVEGLRSTRPDGLLFAHSAVRPADVTDGMSNTLLAGERPPSADLILGWWYAGWGQAKDGEGDMVLGVRTRNNGSYGPGCLPGPYHFQVGQFDNQCDAFHFWSPHPGGANFLFADGSVRFLRYEADPILPALATRAGGESVAVPD
jgi:prepilin-type processing-associated H-X9-DG protein